MKNSTWNKYTFQAAISTWKKSIPCENYPFRILSSLKYSASSQYREYLTEGDKHLVLYHA